MGLSTFFNRPLPHALPGHALGDLWISEKHTGWECKVPFAPLTSTPRPGLSTDKIHKP